MNQKLVYTVLIYLALSFSSQVDACRVPHMSPDFDALIRLESVNVSTYRYRVQVPNKMNGSPFFSIYLKYWDSEIKVDDNPTVLEIELETEDGNLVGYLSMSDEPLVLKPYLEVYYQGSDDPCGSIAIKALSEAE